MGEEQGMVEEILEACYRQEGEVKCWLEGMRGQVPFACLYTYYLVLFVELRLNSSLSYSMQVCYH